MIEEKILLALQNIGILINEFNKDTKLSTLLLDSITYVSFFVELEILLNMELSDDFFSVSVLNLNLLDLIEKLTVLKEVEP